MSANGSGDDGRADCDGPRVKATHMVVAFHTAVHDCSVALLANTFLGNLVVDPVGETPHGIVNLAKLHRGTGVILHGSHELVVKVTVVQEDVGIVVPAIEVTLDGLE